MEEILIGNAKIAEFMGWEIERNYAKNPIHGSWVELEKVYYHSSWDWLMPVVDKIEGLGFDSRICGNPSDSGYICDFVDFENNEAACHCSFEEDKITVIWKTILEFIDWYNLNVKNK